MKADRSTWLKSVNYFYPTSTHAQHFRLHDGYTVQLNHPTGEHFSVVLAAYPTKDAAMMHARTLSNAWSRIFLHYNPNPDTITTP